MRDELELKLSQKYPKILNRENVNGRYPYALFGIEAPSGWYDILDDALGKITQHLEDTPLIEGKEHQFTVFQIKEKFGGLRFYVEGSDDVINNIINNAELRSDVTCQSCGKPGKGRTDRRWISTLCDDCNTG